jgi:hypothetical protein
LKYGRSPRVLPNFEAIESSDKESMDARAVITLLEKNMADARDNLLLAKISQASYANEKRSPEIKYQVGDQVMLSTVNRRREYKQTGDGRVAKLMPRYDGPYYILKARPETSTYTLDLPDSTNIFPTFHASQLKPFIPNNNDTFPSRKMVEPDPILVDNQEEQFIERILDAKKVRNSYKYLVRWRGFGPGHDEWLPATKLDDCEALDRWIEDGGPSHTFHSSRLT